MRFLISLILFSICGYVSGRTLPNCGRSVQEEGRVVGGDPTQHGNYPFMVSFNIKESAGLELKGHVCGGTIINENWIVTAAHCFLLSDDIRNYYVYVGLHKLPETDHWAVQKIELADYIQHPAYTNETLRNDIALLRTARPIDIAASKGYVNGICLPTTKDDPTGDVKVIGWGHEKQNGTISDILREVDLAVISRDVCDKTYDLDPNVDTDNIADTQICAGNPNKDACQYDSGGPLFQTSKEGIATLVGIVSYGFGCGQNPGVYTKVAMFKEWIDEKTQ